MLKVPESTTGSEYKTKPNQSIPDEVIPVVRIAPLSNLPKYSAPTLIHLLEVGTYDKVWSFNDRLPRLATSDIGTKIIKVPPGCDSILFMTVATVLNNVPVNFSIHPNNSNELALFGYVPTTPGSTLLLPEARIGSIGLPSLGNLPETVHKDMGDGTWEVMLKPAIMPVCGFDLVYPAYHGLTCSDENKPFVTKVTVWAVPVNFNYATPVI